MQSRVKTGIIPGEHGKGGDTLGSSHKNRANRNTIIACVLLGILAAGVAVSLCVFFPTLRETLRVASETPTPVPDFPLNVMAVTRDPSEPTRQPVLQNGSQGDKVTELQTKLRALGYYTGEVDGRFGNGTRDAVRFFQQVNGLDADGIAGEQTMKMLESGDAIRAPEITPPPSATPEAQQ